MKPILPVLRFKEPTMAVTGRLQLIFMRGEKPTIVGSDILIDPSKTQIVNMFDDKNLVVDEGRKVLNKMINGDIAADPITTFCTGTGGYIGEPGPSDPPNDPLGTDVDLYVPLFSKEVNPLSGQPNALATVFEVVVDTDESNGNLSEFGLKTQSGKLFARRTTHPMWKDENVFFVVRWTIQF